MNNTELNHIFIRKYFTHKASLFLFLCSGFSFVLFVSIIVPMGMQSTGSSTEKLLFPFSGLVVGISWLSIFLKFFIPVLTIDNKKLTYRKNLFRPNKVILISDLLSVTVKDKKLILAYKTKQQNTEKIVSFILKDFLQMDQEQLLNDIKMIFPASKLE